jgi:hypothetical protein
VLVKMLAIYEQLANANMLLSVPQVGFACGSCVRGWCLACNNKGWILLRASHSFLLASGIKVYVCSGKLLTVALLLSSPCVLCDLQAVSMLLAALPNYAGQPLVPPAKEPLQFVQQLHSDILGAVLPLWSHPKAAYVPTGVLTALVRVLQTCAQGPSHASLVLRYSTGRQAPSQARAQPQPDPQLVQQIIDMGFTQARAEEALRRVGANSVELAMEWLFTHPEEPAAPAAGAAQAAGAASGAAGAAATTAAAAAAEEDREDEELTRALLASLSVVGMSPDAVAQRSQQQQADQPRPGQPSDVTIATVEPGSPGPSTAHSGAAAEPGAAAAAAATPAPPAAADAADADEVTTPQHTPVPVVQPGAPVLGVAPAAAVVGAAVEQPAAAAPSAASGDAVSTGIPAPAQLVDGAIHLVAASPSTAFSIADLLVTTATCEEGKNRAALVERLMDECLPPLPPAAGEATSSAAAQAAATAAAGFQAPGKDLLTPARLLLLLLHKDTQSRWLAGSKGLVPRALTLLQHWQSKYSAAVLAYEQAAGGAEASSLEVPVWVEAVLMLLSIMASTQTKLSGSRARDRAASAVARLREVRGQLREARGQLLAAATAAGHDVQMADQPAAPAAGAAAAGPAAEAGAAAGAAEAGAAGDAAAAAAAAPPAAGDNAGQAEPAAAGSGAAGVLPAELKGLPGLTELLDSWKPCGVLDEQQQQDAMSFGLTLLTQLHAHADEWDRSSSSMFEADGSLPNPGALTQALLQLLDNLTKRFCNAQQLLAAGGHRLLLSLPAACLNPTISRQEGVIGSLLRHLLEDPSTLEGWMESEIKNSMALKGQHGMRDPYTGRALYNQTNPQSR